MVLHFRSHLECSFGNVKISTVQDNALCAVKYRHADNSLSSEGHLVKVRAQGELIADRTYALRQT